MKNTITFLLISLLQCIVYGQNTDLIGTWQTDDKVHEIKIDALLNGTYENTSNKRTLKFIANGLSNEENQMKPELPNAIAVSISLMNDHEGDKVNSTMTGQMYTDGNTKTLQLFHVMKTDNNDLNSGETLFFKKTDNISPLVIHNEIANSDSSLEGLIGPWKNSGAPNGLNIIHIIGNNISATYNYLDPNMKQNFLIKLKGYVQSTTNGNYSFSLSGISLPFQDTVRVEDSKKYYQLNSFSMSLVGEIIDNGSNYSIKSSLNLAHAYGLGANYSAVRSQGAYFTKSKTSSFDYEVIQNGMQRLNFTNNGATNWVSNMKIGSTQTLKMALDTGGNYDWVNSTQCTVDACTKYEHTQFNHSKSNSFIWINEDQKPKDWGPWGGSKANLGFDLVKIDPSRKAFPREINLIIDFNPLHEGTMDQFNELLWDGALAIPSYSSGGKYNDENVRISNVIIDLVTSGTIDPDKLKVSFYYDKDKKQGTYVIGSGVIDATKVDIESKITLAQKNYVDPKITKDPYAVSYLWSTALNSVKVGGETIEIDASKTVFAFDTGSSALKGDSIKMVNLNKKLKLELKNLPTIEYSMGMNKEGQTGRFVITPEQYNQEIEEGDEKGTKQIQVQSLGSVPNLWCQGTTLLEDLYSVFTYDISFNTRGELVLKARNVELYNKIDGPQIIQPQFTCEEEYTDSGGISGNYENNVSETIVYRPGTKGERVALQLFEIDIESNYDFLSIYDGPNDSEANLLKTYTGYHVGEKIISSHPSGALTVKFTSDGSVTSSGWNAKINKCEAQDKCREEYTDTGGELGNYEDYAYTTTVFKPDTKGEKVALHFDYIDIEQNYDYLIIFDGPSVNWLDYKTHYSGSYKNEKITSTHASGKLTTLFISDHSVTKLGWKACVKDINTAFRGLTDHKKEQNIILNNTLIYPNPVTSELHIMIPSMEQTKGDSEISILNILGKVVGNYTYKESTPSLKLDLSSLSTGTYFVKISNKIGVSTKKIMKQ
jgi:hypothetical protein